MGGFLESMENSILFFKPFNMLSDMKLRYEEKGSLWLDFPKVP